ncbi:hypothetical protein NLG97_g7302 [Lecanicillium saksenae]|uniref:Uncharacterized protein n=1 Tax=Lecanicillium saksenae TaxID=468837 RepID=A0ACC1QM70_9HYPO|nr:hypothetical protein NLG97_g7302 [Lecanicillium saksenae]
MASTPASQTAATANEASTLEQAHSALKEAHEHVRELDREISRLALAKLMLFHKKLDAAQHLDAGTFKRLERQAFGGERPQESNWWKSAARDGLLQSLERMNDTLEQIKTSKWKAEAVQLKQNALVNSLSHPHLRGARVMSLPEEILLCIFELVHNFKIDSAYGFGSSESRNEIQNIRLVCRRFCHVSSHLLMSAVRVGCSEESLRRLDEISRHSVFSRGVRSVRLVLHFYNSSFRNLNEFIAHYTNEADFQILSQDRPGMWELLNVSEQDGARMIAEGRAVVSKLRQLTESNSSDADAGLRSRVEEVHQRYIASLDKQKSLIESGHFTSVFGSAIARMPAAHDLEIHDSDVWAFAPQPLFSPQLGFWDAFCRRMLWPLTGYQTAGSTLDNPRYECIGQAIGAAQKAGATLNSLKLTLCTPGAAGSWSSAHDQLVSGGMRRLTSFEFSCREFESYEDCNQFSKFLSTCLDTGTLQNIRIHLDTGDTSTTPRLDLAQVMGSSCRDRLTSLQLHCFLWHASTLSCLWKRLPSSIGYVRLYNMRLQSGTWSQVLDVLRQKTYGSIHLQRPSGGEDLSDAAFEAIFEPVKKPRNKLDLFTKAGLYIGNYVHASVFAASLHVHTLYLLGRQPNTFYAEFPALSPEALSSSVDMESARESSAVESSNTLATEYEAAKRSNEHLRLLKQEISNLTKAKEIWFPKVEKWHKKGDYTPKIVCDAKWLKEAEDAGLSRSVKALTRRLDETTSLEAGLERERDDNWARINALSRRHLRKIGIMEMPDELLLRIFEFVEGFDWREFPRLRYKQYPSRQDLQNARLVCKQFCDIVSPFLVRFVRVSLTESSLKRLDQISHHPTISKGVHTVRIALEFYNASLVNFEAFTSYLVTELTAAIHHFRSKMMSTKDCGGHTEDDASQAIAEAVIASWDLGSCVDGKDGKDDAAKAAQLRLRGVHQQFQCLFESQTLLMQGDNFSRTFGSAIARMPCARNIEFQDGDSTSHTRCWGLIRPGRDIWDGLRDMVLQTMTGETAAVNIFQLPSYRCIVDILDGIRNANVLLRGIEIELTSAGDPERFLPPNGIPEGFSSGMSCLQFFGAEFRFSTEIEDPGILHQFLSACLDTASLKKLVLNMKGAPRFPSRVDLRQILGLKSRALLTDIYLKHLTFDLPMLRLLLQSSQTSMGRIDLHHVQLVGLGTWKEVLEVLQQKHCTNIKLTQAQGAECASMDKKRYVRIFSEGRRRPSLAEQYINNKSDCPNPLEEFEDEDEDGYL